MKGVVSTKRVITAVLTVSTNLTEVYRIFFHYRYQIFPEQLTEANTRGSTIPREMRVPTEAVLTEGPFGLEAGS